MLVHTDIIKSSKLKGNQWYEEKRHSPDQILAGRPYVKWSKWVCWMKKPLPLTQHYNPAGVCLYLYPVITKRDVHLTKTIPELKQKGIVP